MFLVILVLRRIEMTQHQMNVNIVASVVKKQVMFIDLSGSRSALMSGLSVHGISKVNGGLPHHLQRYFIPWLNQSLGSAVIFNICNESQRIKICSLIKSRGRISNRVIQARRWTIPKQCWCKTVIKWYNERSQFKSILNIKSAEIVAHSKRVCGIKTSMMKPKNFSCYQSNMTATVRKISIITNLYSAREIKLQK